MIYTIWINGEQKDSISLDGQNLENPKLHMSYLGEFLGNALTSADFHTTCPIVAYPGHLQPPMGINQYVSKVVTTETIDYTLVLERLSKIPMLRLLHGIIGKMTELGELADNFKRHIFYGTPLLVEEKGGLVEELGDDSWYSALIASVTESLNGDTLAVILEKNIAKLAKRYKKGFSEEEAVNRNIDEEAKALKGDQKI